MNFPALTLDVNPDAVLLGAVAIGVAFLSHILANERVAKAGIKRTNSLRRNLIQELTVLRDRSEEALNDLARHSRSGSHIADWQFTDVSIDETPILAEAGLWAKFLTEIEARSLSEVISSLRRYNTISHYLTELASTKSITARFGGVQKLEKIGNELRKNAKSAIKTLQG